MNAQSPVSVSVALLKKYDRPGPRYTSYPTVPVWTEEVTGRDYREALLAASRRVDEPLALYCHIPFCRRRCYYCGCNTVVTKSVERVTSYVDTVVREIEQTAKLLGERNLASQLHFGGGTPTFLDVEGLNKVITAFEKHFAFTADSERSIEIDPRVTTVEHLEFLAGRGFNRISMGVQDFDHDVQTAVGRIQPFDEVAAPLEHCRRLKFKGINFDLIYGLPRQTPDAFRATLDKTISLRPDRLAVYSFAYLPQSLPHQSKIRPEDLPATEVKYELFAAAVEKLTGAGYLQIGMDHFALPDDELSRAQSEGRLHRNFMGYTVQAAPEMIGIGMSSIGYVDQAYFQNYSQIDSYQRSIDEHGFATYRGRRLTSDDIIRQYVISSLMCNFRLEFDKVARRHGVDFADYFRRERLELSGFIQDGLMEDNGNALLITPLGRTFVRNIAMTFDAYLTPASAGEKPAFSRTI